MAIIEQLKGILDTVPKYKVDKIEVTPKGMVKVSIITDCNTLDHK